ncbi:retrovirus-related pol polyprotein from transposon TNT 1-94 [Tanacetum coccineum]
MLGRRLIPHVRKRKLYTMVESVMRYTDRKKETRKLIRHLIHVGPYEFKKIAAIETASEKTQFMDDLTDDDLKQYEEDIDAKNLILLSIPNDIYNSGADLSEEERHSRFMNEFDKFTSKAGESLTSVYERFSRLVNDMDRNKIRPINMVVNTKFLNSLQPKWNKYVTNVRLVYASREKRAAKTHDPLALVANTYACSLSFRSLPAYYVTHPPSVIGYDDDYQGKEICDDPEDSLTIVMILLARVITQRYSTPTNHRLRTYSNTRNQAIIQVDHVNIQSKNVGNSGRYVRRITDNQENSAGNMNCNAKGHYAKDCPKPRVRGSKCFQEQILLAKKDEVKIILNDEHNYFLLADAFEVEEFEELNATVCMMAQIQQAGSDSDNGPIYDSEFISEVYDPSMSFLNDLYSEIDHEQKYHEQYEITKPIIGDDQINSDIIFDDPNMEVNDGQVEQDKNAHDQRVTAMELLVKNVQQEAEKQRTIARELHDASSLRNIKFHVDVCDTEEILDDAKKSRLKMKGKLDDPIAIGKNEHCEKLKQNELLNDRLLEATLTHDVEKCVLIHSETKNDNLSVEIEKNHNEFKDVQENLLKRIKILENEFQRCQA